MDHSKREEKTEHPLMPLTEHGRPLPTVESGAQTAPALAMPSSSPASPVAAQNNDSLQIPGYQLRRVLGQGGMGVVYEAADLRLGRTVAIKLLREDRSNDEPFRQRFLREAQAVAALQSDHIIPIYHVGDVQLGQGKHLLYLVMPLLTGQNLQERLQYVKRLGLSELVQLARETAIGLAIAHAAKIVHRDIKPANIWLEAPRVTTIAGVAVQTGFRVKLLDFGLARRLTNDDQVTQSGIMIGTPAYMAPEQMNASEPDPRSDVFSLGVVLYECATGQRPYQHLFDLLKQPPADPRTLRPDLPERLALLILQMLQLKPNDRPADAQVVLQAIHAYEQATTELVERPRHVATAATLQASPLTPTPAPVIAPGPTPVQVAPTTPSANPTPTPASALSPVVVAPPPARSGWKRLLLRRTVAAVLLAASVALVLYGGQFLPRRFYIESLWTTSDRIIRSWQAEPDVLQSLALSPDGQLLVLLNSTGQLSIWDAEAATLRHTLPAAVSEPRVVRFSSDGKYVIGAGGVRNKGQVVVQPADGNGSPITIELANAVLNLSTNPKHGLIVGTLGGDIAGYDPATGKQTFALPNQNAIITALAVSPDGKQLAFAANDRTINHWILDPIRSIRVIKGHTATVSALAFNSDSTLLASGALDRTVRVWKTDTGKNVNTFHASRHTIRTLQFSSNGFYLYSADGDLGKASDLVIWDLIRGRLVQTLYGHLDIIQHFDLTPDNRSAYSGSHDGWIIRWHLGAEPMPTR